VVLGTNEEVKVPDGLGVYLGQCTSRRAHKLGTYVTLSVGSVNITLRGQLDNRGSSNSSRRSLKVVNA
jgi:hypothetical protein